MMVELDDVICIGTITIAALVRRSVHGQFLHAVFIHGAKSPVAVLIRCDDVTIAFDIDGPQIALDDFEQRFPGQRAEFERITTSNM